MKRSEMELYIEQIIIEHHGYKDTNCVLANNILKAVEEAGMLPPETKATVGDFKGQFFDQKFIDDHDLKLNKWEPEDE